VAEVECKDGEPAQLALVLTTCPDGASAEALAQVLLDNRLAACVSISQEVMSHYTWQGKRERTAERLLFIKTPPHLTRQLARTIAENHPYEAPEILLLCGQSLSPAYNRWFGEVCLRENGG